MVDRMRVVIHQLDPNDAPAIAGLCRVYEESIPGAERKPAAALDDMCARPDYVIMVARAEHATGDAIGFGAVFVPAGGQFALLEYLAITAAARGAGLGTLLFESCCGIARSRDPNAPLAVEVDSI